MGCLHTESRRAVAPCAHRPPQGHVHVHAPAIAAAWPGRESGHRRPGRGTLKRGKAPVRPDEHVDSAAAHADFSYAGLVARDEGIALISLARLDSGSKKPAKTEGLAEERKRLLALVSPSLRDRYTAALTSGQRPAVCILDGARCSGCGERMSEASRRLLTENFRVVACTGCLRLLYDCAWVERDFLPLTLRPRPYARR